MRAQTTALIPVATALALRELEPLAGLRTARLLALDRARIAREQAEVAQLAAVGLVDLHERASDGEAQRAGLARLMPPPSRCAFTSKRPSVSVAVNGCWIAETSVGRGK